MKNIINFLSFTDIPIGLANFSQTKIVPLRLLDLKSDTPPKYSIYYHDNIISHQ